MKSSSTIIISLLGGMALGCAAAKLMHSQKAKQIKECLGEQFADEISKFHEKFKEKHDGLVALIEKNRCTCKDGSHQG